MSFQNKNLYDLLGNDVEEDVAPSVPTREVVKKNTSSKKADVAPASADPAKAKNNKKKVTGNEAALKNKTNNKEVAPPQSSAAKHTKKPFDRHSRTGKTDSKKKFKQGWGESDKRELEGEVEGAEDAEAELSAEASENADAADSTPKKTLQEYLAEMELKRQELDGAKKLRQANEGAEAKWTSEEKIEKQQEVFFASTHAKKAKAKAQKEKVFLDIDASFADEQPQQSRGGFRGGKRGGPRGGARRGGAPRAAATGSTKPEVNDKNFPSL
ncbi:Ray38p [Candida maltosa Xu316]|uniref:Ray38p n=2 Tax=Candida maltosa TaxID=5479 RepID=M3HIT4_CANMX|nr:Ray38p [Candida maltosa Xu316]BAB47177.1 Ray38p [Candida maltosa]